MKLNFFEIIKFHDNCCCWYAWEELNYKNPFSRFATVESSRGSRFENVN